MNPYHYVLKIIFCFFIFSYSTCIFSSALYRCPELLEIKDERPIFQSLLSWKFNYSTEGKLLNLTYLSQYITFNGFSVTCSYSADNAEAKILSLSSEQLNPFKGPWDASMSVCLKAQECTLVKKYDLQE